MTLRLIYCFALIAATAARGQAPIEGEEGVVRLLPADASILDSHELRTEMPCAVKAVRPELGFDLDFHSGYEVSVPLKELAGDGNLLTTIFRVIPDGRSDDATYFSQKWTVPPIVEEAQGVADLQGSFILGEGRYEVEWLIRDRSERYCSAHWQISADARGKDRKTEPRRARGTAAPEAGPFVSEGPVKRDAESAARVVVLLHIASQATASSGKGPPDTAALLSILRSIAREPRIASYSITAFNLARSEVLFRSENVPEVDFPALGEALQHFRPETIDVRQLGDYGGVGFLTKLLHEEMGKNRVDALILLGPKTHTELKVRGALKEFEGPNCPVFYLNYNSDPASNPWRDAIGSLVKIWKGLEYSITRPRDLSVAWNDVMSRISNTQHGAGGPGSSMTLLGIAPKK